MTECPVCGSRERNDQDLLDHVMLLHCEPIDRTYYPNCLTCWCGLEFEVGGGVRGEWAVHLLEEGGLAHHYLSCKLGLGGSER